MMRISQLLFITALSAMMFLASCKKKEDPEPAAKQTDQSGSTSTDEGIADVNDYISNNIGNGSSKSSRVAAYDLPCGVVRVDSVLVNGKYQYTLHYGSQTPCNVYKRKSGDISFQLSKGASFSAVGAVFTIKFTNYKVEGSVNKDVITLNGTLYVTNVTGGYIWQAVTEGKTITHTLRGTITQTFANGVSRVRNYFQRRTWNSTNSWAGLTFSVDGDSTINATTKISETGKTYEGNYNYQTEIFEVFKWANCGTDFKGPYVLKFGKAKMNATIPALTPAYFQIEAGFHQDLSNLSATPDLVNDCSSNAYKISIQLGTTSKTEYQLY